MRRSPPLLAWARPALPLGAPAGRRCQIQIRGERLSRARSRRRRAQATPPLRDQRKHEEAVRIGGVFGERRPPSKEPSVWVGIGPPRPAPRAHSGRIARSKRSGSACGRTWRPSARLAS
eukprot:5816855-Alexandrium_andersonii.AAC.1